jgi:hypothetical protein
MSGKKLDGNLFENDNFQRAQQACSQKFSDILQF